MNPYKYFADELGSEDPVSGLIVEERGNFTPSGNANNRVFEIQFPTDPGPLVFILKRQQSAVFGEFESDEKRRVIGVGRPADWITPGPGRRHGREHGIRLRVTGERKVQMTMTLDGPAMGHP